MEQTKSKRGGRREGAGRKRSGLTKTEILNTRCAKDVRKKLETYSKNHVCTLAQALEDMVLAFSDEPL